MKSYSGASSPTGQIISCLKVDPVATGGRGCASQKVQLAPIRARVGGDDGISLKSPSGRRGGSIECQGLVRRCCAIDVEVKL